MSDTKIIQLRSHPHDPDIVLVHVPPGFSDRTIMGRLEAARWSPEDRAYLLHTDALPGLEGLARYVGAHVVDQRTPATGDTDTPRPVAQECAHCGQPGRWARPPAHCPDCGQPWTPVPPPALNLAVARPTCPDCGKRQRGRFGYCWSCGTALPTGPVTQLRETRHENPVARPRLDEPLPLAEGIDAVLAHAAGGR
ncbi:MAG: hypothetical protein J2P26_08485 [Nocardiopsaceae bacterium]|nr:hypothetical protein [Nocardiopsaceae bacterium]